MKYILMLGVVLLGWCAEGQSKKVLLAEKETLKATQKKLEEEVLTWKKTTQIATQKVTEVEAENKVLLQEKIDLQKEIILAQNRTIALQDSIRLLLEQKNASLGTPQKVLTDTSGISALSHINTAFSNYGVEQREKYQRELLECLYEVNSTDAFNGEVVKKGKWKYVYGGTPKQMLGFVLIKTGTELALHMNRIYPSTSEGKYVLLKFTDNTTLKLDYSYGIFNNRLNIEEGLKSLQTKKIAVVRFERGGQTGDIYLKGKEQSFLIENLKCFE